MKAAHVTTTRKIGLAVGVVACLFAARLALGDSGLLLDSSLALLAALSAWRARRLARRARSRRAWRFQILFPLVWSVAPVAWLAGDQAVIADALRLAAILCAIAAWWHTSHAVDTWSRVRLVVDGGLAAVAIFVAGWGFVFHEAWSQKGGGAQGAMAIAIPVAAVGAATFLIGLTLTEMQGRSRLMPALFVAALVVLAWSDVAWARAETPLWAAGWGIAVVATRTYQGTSDRREVISTHWQYALAPYLLVAPAAIAVAVGWDRGGVAGPQAAGGVVMAFLLLVRQHVTLLENRRLVQRLAETESLLRHQATHDHLTGLAGRVLLLERLQKITTMPSVTAFPVALIFIDLDGFKAVNDRHGHAGGDHLLMEVARRLGRLLEPVGDSALAVRVSGDEFAVLLERDQAIAAEPLARQILDELTHPINVNGAVVSVGASVGVASATSASLDASRLLAAADEAMYRMKREGKGGVEIADGALPTQGRNARPSPHVALGAPIDDERSVAMNDHSWSDKAKGALPDDDTVEQASDKVQDKSPDQVDTEVAKAEQWTKDHNKD